MDSDPFDPQHFSFLDLDLDPQISTDPNPRGKGFIEFLHKNKRFFFKFFCLKNQQERNVHNLDPEPF